MIKLTEEQKQLLKSQEWEEEEDGTWVLYAQFAGGIHTLKTQEHALEEIESIQISKKHNEQMDNYYKKKKENDLDRLILKNGIVTCDNSFNLKYVVELNLGEIQDLISLTNEYNTQRYIGYAILEKLKQLHANKSS